MNYKHIRGVVLDMDGVLWRGMQPLPGLPELFAWLAESQTPYALATNNSSKTQADYIRKLATMGIDGVPEERIITSGTATAAYLSSRYIPGTRVHLLGMAGLAQILTEAGFDVVTGGDADDTDDEPIEVVVAGVDFELTYAKLRRAALLIRAGAEFIGTNPDRTFPSPEGLVPGAGSLIAALEAATDRRAIIMGKPASPMFQTALDVLDVPPAQALMIGDRRDTDILGAQEVGMQTALVFTGVTTPDDLTGGEVWPDVAYEGLPDLLKAWAGDAWYRERVKAARGR